MSATTINQNGETRKSLASQIDRLDNMLDNLAEGINDTVVDAVKEAVGHAVRQAVQAAITEVLTNTVLQERLRSAAAPVSEPVAPRSSAVVHGIRRACCWLASVVKDACRGTYAAVRWIGSTTKESARESVLAIHHRGRQACRYLKAFLRSAWLRILVVYNLSRWVYGAVVVLLCIYLGLAAVGSVIGPFLASMLSGLLGQVLILVTLARRQIWKTGGSGPWNEAE